MKEPLILMRIWYFSDDTRSRSFVCPLSNTTPTQLLFTIWLLWHLPIDFYVSIISFSAVELLDFFPFNLIIWCKHLYHLLLPSILLSSICHPFQHKTVCFWDNFWLYSLQTLQSLHFIEFSIHTLSNVLAKSNRISFFALKSFRCIFRCYQLLLFWGMLFSKPNLFIRWKFQFIPLFFESFSNNSLNYFS